MFSPYFTLQQAPLQNTWKLHDKNYCRTRENTSQIWWHRSNAFSSQWVCSKIKWIIFLHTSKINFGNSTESFRVHSHLLLVIMCQAMKQNQWTYFKTHGWCLCFKYVRSEYDCRFLDRIMHSYSSQDCF